MGPTQVYYSFYGRFLTIAAAAVAILAIAAVAFADGMGEALRVGAGGFTVAYLTWMAFWAPRVVVSDGGVEVHNIARSAHIPWPALREVSVRWSLEIRSTTFTIAAWSAPTSGAFALRRGRPSASGAQAVAEAIAARQNALRSAGYLKRTTTGAAPTATTAWNTWQLAVLGAAVAATVALWAR